MVRYMMELQTKEQLVQSMVANKVLKTPVIINAFSNVDRADFVNLDYLANAYADRPLPIGYGQTISQPSTIAFMLELLAPKAGERVLEVGAGSGWVATILAEIVGAAGEVYGVELHSKVLELAKQNTRSYQKKNLQLLQAGYGLGLPEAAPFDLILVSAASEILPHELVEQLAIGGTMVIPIKESIWHIAKISEVSVKATEFPGFRFVPLLY